MKTGPPDLSHRWSFGGPPRTRTKGRRWPCASLGTLQDRHPRRPALTLVQRTGQLGPHVAVRAGALRLHSQRHKQGRVGGFGTSGRRRGGGGHGGSASQRPRDGPAVSAESAADGRPVPGAAPRREPSPQHGTPGEGHRERRAGKRGGGGGGGGGGTRRLPVTHTAAPVPGKTQTPHGAAQGSARWKGKAPAVRLLKVGGN